MALIQEYSLSMQMRTNIPKQENCTNVLFVIDTVPTSVLLFILQQGLCFISKSYSSHEDPHGSKLCKCSFYLLIDIHASNSNCEPDVWHQHQLGGMPSCPLHVLLAQGPSYAFEQRDAYFYVQ
jgi:hypothetical protein